MSRVQLGNSVFLSSGDRDLGLPIKVQQESQASSGVEAWNSAFLSSCQRGVRPPVEFRQGFGLFQEDRQGRQASHPVVRGYSVFHWSRCRGIRTHLELRGNSASFFLAAGSAGVPLEIQFVTQASSCGAREVGIPLELKQGMGPHLQMRWNTQGSSRAVAGTSAFILSCDGDLWAPLSCMKGVKPPLEF